MTGQPKSVTPVGSSTPWRLFFLLLAVIATLAAILRLAGISLESLDSDEIFSYRVAVASASNALQIIRQDLVHPPLFYYAAHFFVSLAGAGAFTLRAVSLLSGIATVVLLLYAGIRLVEFRIAIWTAAALLAVNNTHIFYSQQARSAAFYTLLLTGFLLWSWLLASRNQRPLSFWLGGGLLMVMIIYTHYIGSVYVVCVVGALLSQLKGSLRTRLALMTIAAGLTFVPWLILEASVYAHKKGLGENLGWVQSPGIYQLKLLWANYMGVPDLPGATTLVFVLGMFLIGCAALYRERTSLVTAVLLTLTATAFIPPVVVFALSQKPLALPIFGERHLLPSIVSWLILVAYGLTRLASRAPIRRAALTLGMVLLFGLQLAPTITALRTMPRRLSYSDIAKNINGDVPVYATAGYDIKDPVAFYLAGRQTVELLPCSQQSLPDSFVLLYRPEIRPEQQEMEQLTHDGWAIDAKTDYTNAIHSLGYVRLAHLHRTRRPENAGATLCR